ncbi:MAG: hypothetical protein SWQ30_22305 [Thermodesulfobacteriota bacterium]|nr:hypothetical protein [Thermodesulfobacteriota bacterium]
MRFLEQARSISTIKLACIGLVSFFALSLVAMDTARAADCICCHDGSDPLAPNVGLFYISGHGRCGVQCIDCHDSSIPHDGISRTYAFDPSASPSQYDPALSGVAYAQGYQLKYVGGEVPLMIPTNYNITFSYNAQLIRDTAFRLCFSCHDKTTLLDNTPGDGLNSNFKATLPNPPRDYSYAWGSGADINEHVSHIMNYVGPFADSDWDIGTTGPGGIEGRDTLMTCTSCHNVHGVAGAHGSTNEAMIRDGSLVGRTGYGFSYVVEDTGVGGYPMVTSDGATKSNSTGAILRNNTANMCGGSMCHGNPASPPASSYDATGSSWGTYIEYYRPWQDYGLPTCNVPSPPTCSQPPEVMVEELVNTVIDLNLQNGISNALDAKLDNALASLDDANTNNDVAAINSLNAFINATEAQRGNKISSEDADALIAAAQAIIDQLETG